ncbi:LysM peptidoglycan-binding domain-containing protein [Leucothrix mucor]|uniref:LysM peptidoglycan-binding domain-containing protein n=1 Tax=Leucothrix mucor TaxID=45248 RepID=UPI0003B40473|nr:LysM domain-containing protein [Leucothrix mucor]
MKMLTTSVLTAIMAIGLAGNAAAAPKHEDSMVIKKSHVQTGNHHQKAVKRVATKQVSQKPAKRVVKRVVKQPVKHVAAKRVVKRVVKQQPRKVVKVRTHRVRTGDTLYRIATRYGISVNKLMHLNNLRNANHLKIGMNIRLS